MAKKPSIQPEPEPLTAAKTAAKPKVTKVAKASPAKSSPAKAKSATVTKSEVSKPVPKPAATKVTSKAKKKITAADIELRAYFIAEDRQKQGLPGDAASDWIEAERQLKAEAAVKPIL